MKLPGTTPLDEAQVRLVRHLIDGALPGATVAVLVRVPSVGHGRFPTWICC